MDYGNQLSGESSYFRRSYLACAPRLPFLVPIGNVEERLTETFLMHIGNCRFQNNMAVLEFANEHGKSS